MFYTFGLIKTTCQKLIFSLFAMIFAQRVVAADILVVQRLTEGKQVEFLTCFQSYAGQENDHQDWSLKCSPSFAGAVSFDKSDFQFHPRLKKSMAVSLSLANMFLAWELGQGVQEYAFKRLTNISSLRKTLRRGNTKIHNFLLYLTQGKVVKKISHVFRFGTMALVAGVLWLPESWNPLSQWENANFAASLDADNLDRANSQMVIFRFGNVSEANHFLYRTAVLLDVEELFKSYPPSWPAKVVIEKAD